jgi:hypothetical protein
MAPIPLEVLEQLPETVDGVSKQNTKRLGYITDTSTAKEMITKNANVQILLGYFDAVAKAGTEIKMKMVKRTVVVNGQSFSWDEPTVDYAKHTPAPSTAFIAKLSMDPSVHPGWKTAENIFGTAFKFGTIAFGIDRFTGMVTSMTDTPTYSNSPVIQSYNKAGAGQEFGMEGQYQGPYAPVNEPAAGGEEESSSSEWFNGIVGCSSGQSYIDGKCSVQP